MPEDQSKHISLWSQQGLSGEKNILGWMVMGHGGMGGHHLRATTVLPACAPWPGHTPATVLPGGGLWGPSGTQGLMVRAPHSAPLQEPPSKAAGSGTAYLAEGKYYLCDREGVLRGLWRVTVSKGVQHGAPCGLTLPCPVLHHQQPSSTPWPEATLGGGRGQVTHQKSLSMQRIQGPLV